MDNLNFLHTVIYEKLEHPFTEADIKLIALACKLCIESIGTSQFDITFKRKYLECFIMLIYGGNKERLSTLKDCEVVLESIKLNGASGALILMTLIFAIEKLQDNSERAKELLERIKNML
jgi:hypothetical protein